MNPKKKNENDMLSSLRKQRENFRNRPLNANTDKGRKSLKGETKGLMTTASQEINSPQRKKSFQSKKKELKLNIEDPNNKILERKHSMQDKNNFLMNNLTTEENKQIHRKQSEFIRKRVTITEPSKNSIEKNPSYESKKKAKKSENLEQKGMVRKQSLQLKKGDMQKEFLDEENVDKIKRKQSQQINKMNFLKNTQSSTSKGVRKLSLFQASSLKQNDMKMKRLSSKEEDFKLKKCSTMFGVESKKNQINKKLDEKINKEEFIIKLQEQLILQNEEIKDDERPEDIENVDEKSEHNSPINSPVKKHKENISPFERANFNENTEFKLNEDQERNATKLSKQSKIEKKVLNHLKETCNLFGNEKSARKPNKFTERMQQDILKRQSKEQRLNQLFEKVKVKLDEKVRTEAFNRLIEDSNRRVEKIEKMKKMQEELLKVEDSINPIKRKYKYDEWLDIYTQRFESKLKSKNEKLRELNQIKEEHKKKQEIEEMKELYVSKKVSKKKIESTVFRLHKQAEIDKLKNENKIEEAVCQQIIEIQKNIKKENPNALSKNFNKISSESRNKFKQIESSNSVRKKKQNQVIHDARRSSKSERKVLKKNEFGLSISKLMNSISFSNQKSNVSDNLNDIKMITKNLKKNNQNDLNFCKVKYLPDFQSDIIVDRLFRSKFNKII